ncbi:MAG: SIS domain-containing protein, partial [Alphaproteobacteria bacterium]|nr:SIS domain-containing protein [Alphaproteobacteria bacterium]
RHAEAFSGAEFLHGPVALVEPHFPILMFMPEDETAEGMVQLAADLAGKGAALLIAGARRDKASGPQWLPALAPDHPETDAVCLIQSFYAMMVRLAEQLGIDPDRPRHLQKVTRTR